jgi:hypothetical protein
MNLFSMMEEYLWKEKPKLERIVASLGSDELEEHSYFDGSLGRPVAVR